MAATQYTQVLTISMLYSEDEDRIEKYQQVQ
jgi:hypothetical protein